MARQKCDPLVFAVTHAKGGGQDNTALITAKYLAGRHRVALLDHDEGAHLTDLVHDLFADGHTITRRLWFATDLGRLCVALSRHRAHATIVLDVDTDNVLRHAQTDAPHDPVLTMQRRLLSSLHTIP